MLSQTGDYIGKKKKIEDSPEMKKHFEVRSFYLLSHYSFYIDFRTKDAQLLTSHFTSPR
jgi:hypothetical protein